MVSLCDGGGIRQHWENEISVDTQNLPSGRTDAEADNPAAAPWRARLLDALHHATIGLVDRVELKDVLEHLITHVCLLVNTPHAFVELITADRQYMRGIVNRGVFAGDPAQLERGHGMVGKIWQSGQPVNIADYQGWSDRADTDIAHQLQSALGVPIRRGNETIGVLGVARSEPGSPFDDADLNVLQRFAALIALACENTRLIQVERRNRRVAESLREVLNVVNTESSLERVLEFILLQAAQLNDAQKALLVRVNPSRTEIVVQCGYNVPADMIPHLRIPVNPEIVARSSKWEGLVFPNRILRFFIKRMRTIGETREDWAAALFDVRSFLSGQIYLGNEVFGGIMLFYDYERAFNHEDHEVMRQLTTHASIAIQTARLRAQSAMNAAAQERNRLGRELHDSVSQALFSIVLHAQAAQQIAQTNPARLNEPLTELLSLSQAALTEMRALIFEMRPELLEREGLLGMFFRQAESMQTRHRLGVSLNMPMQEPVLPLKVKEAVYRVALEALNNVVKHARAKSVHIAFTYNDHVLNLAISDDGVGFDLSHSHDGHLGLITMRERVDSLGGRLDLESNPTTGTTIALEIPLVPFV